MTLECEVMLNKKVRHLTIYHDYIMNVGFVLHQVGILQNVDEDMLS